MYIKRDAKWSAEIWKNRIRYQLGRFINKQDAIEARKKAELELYGHFSYIASSK